MAVDIVTFGCRLNTYESEVMRRETEAAGLGQLENGAIVFNTCAVTGEAVRQARQAIRKARRENPDTRIIVTGCAAQTEPASFGEMEEVDLVIGNDDKLKAQSYRALPEFGVNQFEKVRVNDIFEVTETASHMVDAIEGRARAFVQVQNGCDHRCTFCIIPYGRGNSRSVPMGAAVDQVKRLAENGYREVVLTGVDLTSYGPDLPGKPTLGRLVRSPSPSVQFLLVWSHGRAVFPPPGPHLPAVSGCGTVPCCSKPPGLHRLPSGAPPASSGCKACRSAPTTVRACPAAAAAASQVGRAVQPVICGGGGRAISTHSVGSAVCRSPGASCAPPGPPRAADNSSGRVSAPPTRARARPGRRQRRQGFGAAPPARRSR